MLVPLSIPPSMFVCRQGSDFDMFLACKARSSRSLPSPVLCLDLWLKSVVWEEGFLQNPQDPWDWYIYPHLADFFMIHVGRYTIHGSYGKWNCPCFHFRGQMLSSNKLQNERKTYFINSSPEYKLSWESRDRGFVGIKKIQNSPCAQGLQRKVEIFSSPWLLWHKHLKQHEIRTWTTSPGHG